jgi:hypothetical protein
MNDFLLTAHSSGLINNDHFLIVQDRLIEHMHTYYEKNDQSLTSLVAIHLSFANMNEEFKLFALFLSNSPAERPFLLKINVSNLNICYLASKIVCRRVTQLKDKMEKEDWKRWLGNVSNSSWLVESFVNKFVANKTHNLTDIDEFQSLWERSTVLRLFIEHVCTEQSTNMYDYCLPLWKYLTDPVNFKTEHTIGQLIKFLNTMHDALKNQFKEKCKRCTVCQRVGFLNKPEQCADCLPIYENASKCPGCEGDIDKKSINRLEPVVDEQLVNFENSKTNIDIFFFDVVSTLCLNDGVELPNRQVIDELINT